MPAASHTASHKLMCIWRHHAIASASSIYAYGRQHGVSNVTLPSIADCKMSRNNPGQADNVAGALQSTLQRVSNRSNVADMSVQPFYKWIQDTYTWHVVGLFAALYAIGGFPAMVWGGALRIAFVYHITWFVNSASHCWGYQSYNTGMESLLAM